MSKYLAFCSTTSGDGQWHARYPNGNAPAPGINLYSIATASALSGGVPSTGIRLDAGAREVSRATSAISTAIRMSGAARDRDTGAGTLGSVSAGATFDFYVSPTGSDTNTGTLGSPWAISSLAPYSINANNLTNWGKTGGKRVGFLPGTYDIASLAAAIEAAKSPAQPFGSAYGPLAIIGGTSGSWSVWASSDSSGHQSPRTATLNFKTSGGVYGGGVAASVRVPMLAHTGTYPSAYALGYAMIDGLRFTGFEYKAVRIGGASSSDGAVLTAPVTVQNCEFYGGGYNTGDPEDNFTALWIDPFQVSSGQGMLATNNWFHDTVGWNGALSADHVSAIQVWGFSTQCYGVEISYNTVVNAGYYWGKEGGINGCTIHHNYIDSSMYTNTSMGFGDFMSGGQSFTGLTHATQFYNNVVILQGGTAGGSCAFGFPTLSETGFGSSFGWQTQVSMFNNTIVSASGSRGPAVCWADAALNESGIGQVKIYNNIYVNNGTGGSWNGFGNFLTTAKSPAIWDYNLYPSTGVEWSIVPDANNGSLCASQTIHTTATSFASGVTSGGGISGVEAHGIAGVPTFTGTGIYAAKYQLAVGSTGIGAGSTTGASGGSACDMGAWGGATVPTKIGCDFAT